jgi:hypothetical protein
MLRCLDARAFRTEKLRKYLELRTVCLSVATILTAARFWNAFIRTPGGNRMAYSARSGASVAGILLVLAPPPPVVQDNQVCEDFAASAAIQANSEYLDKANQFIRSLEERHCIISKESCDVLDEFQKNNINGGYHNRAAKLGEIKIAAGCS